MKMQDVQEIKEVRSVDEANKLLDKGWEILRITQTATGLMFIFGKQSTKGYPFHRNQNMDHLAL